jgi:hypothetical protein
MFMNREKVMEQVKNLPPGKKSASRHYWCMTCKMLFLMDEPVCPFMSKVCINTPIAVETMSPESTASIEKFGLFYPKIPQIIMARLAGEADPDAVARGWVDEYLDFLDEWSFEVKSKSFQVIRSFIIFITGSVTGQRVDQSKVSFVITDPGKIWDRRILLGILEKAVPLLKEKLGIEGDADILEIDITGDTPFGKYFCPMCRKFFEFSHQRETITCPIMAQKCMAIPKDIGTISYTLKDLAVMYEYTPDFYSRFISDLDSGGAGEGILRGVLAEEWNFEIEPESFGKIARLLGCAP